MSDLFKVQLRGLEEFKRTIDMLPDKVKKQVARRGVSASARMLRKELIKNTPKRTGRMRKSWRISVKNYARGIRGRVINVVPYAHLIELGTKPRTRKSGASTGQMIANPIGRSTFHSIRLKLIDEVIQKMRLAVEKYLRKTGR